MDQGRPLLPTARKGKTMKRAREGGAGSEKQFKKAKTLKPQQQESKRKQFPKSAPATHTELSKSQKRDIDKQRKAKRTKNFGLIEGAKSKWEKLRRHDVSDAERKELVRTLLEDISGRVGDVAAQHAASRVIQSCAKYGTAEQRRQLWQEVKEKAVMLAKSSHGHFLISKLVTTAPKDELPGREVKPGQIILVTLMRVMALPIADFAARLVLGNHFSCSSGSNPVVLAHTNPQRTSYYELTQLARQTGMLRVFKGHIPELLRHPCGSAVVDAAYTQANAAQRSAMVAEFYGNEYALFDAQEGTPAKLSELMTRVEPPKRRAIVQRVAVHIVPILEKGLVAPHIVHRVVSEYLEHAPGSAVQDAVEMLSGPNLLHVMHTREGAQAACAVLAYGSAKDRKKAVKAMKGHAKTMALDEWAHVVLITALDRVDDTALLNKTLVAELLPAVLELAEHKHGRRVLLHLLAPEVDKYLPASLRPFLHPLPKTTAAASGASAAAEADTGGGAGGGGAAARGGEEEAAGEGAGPGNARELGRSKKDPRVRRRELLGGGEGSLAAALTSACSVHADSLLRSAAGGDLVVEVARGGSDGLLDEVDGAGIRSVHDAVVELAAAGEPSTTQPRGGAAATAPRGTARDHILEHYFASRALRRLLVAAADPGPVGAAAGALAEALWTRVLQGRLGRWVGGHADKVVAALTSSAPSAVRKAAERELGAVLERPVGEWLARFVGGSGKHGGACQANA